MDLCKRSRYLVTSSLLCTPIEVLGQHSRQARTRHASKASRSNACVPKGGLLRKLCDCKAPVLETIRAGGAEPCNRNLARALQALPQGPPANVTTASCTGPSSSHKHCRSCSSLAAPWTGCTPSKLPAIRKQGWKPRTPSARTASP